jgi:hypothetical protein
MWIMKAKLNVGALGIALAILVAGAGVCRAGDITYQVDQGPIGVDGGAVIGTIGTDGTIGTLAASDILNWNVVVSNGIGGSFDLTNGDSSLSLAGSGLTATATELAIPSGMELEQVLSDTSASCCNASLEFANNVIIGTASPEPSTYGFTLIGLGLLVLMQKRLVPTFR